MVNNMTNTTRTITKPTQTLKLKLKPETYADILANYNGPGDFADVWSGLKKAVIEKMMEGELDYHLGYDKHSRTIDNNARNGTSPKTVYTDTGPVTIDTPRDRDSSFDPMLIRKGQTRGSCKKRVGNDKRLYVGQFALDIRQSCQKIMPFQVV